MRTISFNSFDGGMVNDPRSPAENVCQRCIHFDAFTDEHRLIPHYAAQVGDSSATTNLIKNFAFDGTTIYGLGTIHGGSNAEIYTRTNFTDAIWTALANVGVTQVDAAMPFFTYYARTGKLYGADGNRYIWDMSPTGAGNNQACDLGAASYATVSNGVVHSGTDILYVGYANFIAQNNNGQWTAIALTLPAEYLITSICEYGNYLAIGCRAVGAKNSRVFLWNMDAVAQTVSESIDWGEGNLMLLEELDGYLVGVSYEGDTGGQNVGGSRVSFRAYDGSTCTLFETFTGFSQSPAIQSTLYKFKYHHRILFPATIPITGSAGAQSVGNAGIWAISRTSTGFAVVQEYSYLNTTSMGTEYGIIQIGDFLFASYVSNSIQYMDKTDWEVVYTQTSIYETTINPMQPERYRLSAGARSSQKQLLAVATGMQSLLSGQQVVVKYRVDGGSWITIMTVNTVGTIVQEATTDSTPSQFTSGREYEFRFESTGGAIITEFKYKYEEITTSI